jgi:homoserine O-acetyltransferase
LIGWLDAWGAPIKLDPKWNHGDYYGKEAPIEGLAAALKLVTLHAQHFEWATKTQTGVADAAKDPAKAVENKFKIQATLDTAGAARAKTSDANSFLYLVKANQLADADPGKIKIPALVIYTPTDEIFYPPYVEEAAKKMNAQTLTISGPNGHLNGVLALAPVAGKITDFLAK